MRAMKTYVDSLNVRVRETTVVDHEKPIEIHCRSADGRQTQMQSVDEQTEIDEEKISHQTSFSLVHWLLLLLKQW